MKNNKLNIYRPLVFLCGPAIDKDNLTSDRRFLLSSYLLKKIQNISVGKHEVPFYMIPVIVDDILDEDFMNKHGLKYKVVEEIIASISRRTYIFLDSLSTSYELGLFDSTLSKNTTVLFLENNFDSRKRRAVGKYILKSVSPQNIVRYDFSYRSDDDEKKEFVSFPIDKNGNYYIPSSIIERVNDDFNLLKNKAKEGFKVEFIPTEASKLNQIQYLYDPNKNTISFSLGTRLSFYLSVLLFSNSEKDKMNSSNEYKMGFQKYSKFIFDLFVSSIDLEQINVKELMLFKPTISLHIGKHDDPEYIFRYFICISNRISFLLKQDFDDSFKSLKTNLNFIPSFDKEDDFYKTFFDLKEFDISLIEDYELHPNDYIDEITLRISGKNRKIIKYKDNHKGRHLRRLHEKITLLLQICFPPSKYAFAYKKNSSTKKCVEQHISSQSFIKLDIHSFFNSISLHKISSLLKSRFEIEMEPNHRKVLPSTGEIEKILKCCFYHKKLPLGFVSSPILSDIFMNQTDIIIGERFDGLIYTRYADDILVSSREKCEDLSKCLNIIDDEINKLGLTINNKKKASVHFKNDGDSIHYLGINIVKRRNENELTISKRTLWNDAKKIHKEAKKDKPDYSKIKGIEQYIFEISPKSFDKLNKMYQSAFKTKLP